MIKDSSRKLVEFSFRKVEMHQFDDDDQKDQSEFGKQNQKPKEHHTLPSSDHYHIHDTSTPKIVSKSIDDYLLDIFRLSSGDEHLKKQDSSQSETEISDDLNKLIMMKLISLTEKQGSVITTKSTISRVDLKGKIADKWISVQLQILPEKLQFGAYTYEIKKIAKIKILPLSPASSSIKNRLIKFNYHSSKQSQEVFFSSNAQKNKQKMTVHFQLFSQLLMSKLNSLKVDLNTTWKKTHHTISQTNLNNYIFGTIYKKSQVRNKWMQRYITVKDAGIYSYHSPSDSTPSFFIPADSIKYIWTRFEFVYGFLIVKIKHGLAKTQFGIPLLQFDTLYSNNWLLHFYRIVDRKI